MKKLLILLIVLISVIASGCGDKFAKEKEAITKAEQAAMAMKLPEIIVPQSIEKPTREDWEKYHNNFKILIETETKMLAEMQKSDAKIAEMEKTASESEKKDLKAFKDKIRQARVEFVKKVSKGRLRGDTFIVGVGSTWQEVEMAYGKPIKTSKDGTGFKEYFYDGITFRDWIGKGAPPPEIIKKWVSTEVQAVTVTGNITSDAGAKIGMTKDELYKTLKAKYVRKSKYPEGDPFVSQGKSIDPFEVVLNYSMQDTQPYNLYCYFKDGKLVRYNVAPH